MGPAPTNEEAVALVRGLQERNILVFMAGNSGGKCIAEQLAEEGIQMDWDTFLVPYGKDTTSAIHGRKRTNVIKTTTIFGTKVNVIS